ncbi:MAG: alpha/beta hydrolase [Methylococcales bacterium]
MQLVGCTSAPKLMPTSNLYIGATGYPESEVQLTQKRSQIDMLYVTDRLPESETNQLEYGSGRSASLAFGSAIVEIGKGRDWEQLVKASQTVSKDSAFEMTVIKRVELGRFPETPYAFVVNKGVPVVNTEIQTQLEKSTLKFRKEINRRLNLANRKDVIIYIHGFNNTFDDAITNLAGIWHFMGRQGVPLAYSWPAAYGGAIGYFSDRESGEFTIFHLKNMLRLLASFAEIENIHIIAHSRGTDVVTTALRELIIESRAAGKNPKNCLRVRNLILAAPDLDFSVMRQRLIAEKFGLAFGQVNIYTAQTDNALNFAEMIMPGKRLGHLQSKDFGDPDKQIFTAVKNVHIYQCT